MRNLDIGLDRMTAPALLAGRLLLAAIFLHEGLWLALNFAQASVATAKLGVPPLLLVATIILQVGAGFALGLGWQTRIAAVSLALFCLSTAVLFHGTIGLRAEMIQFEKDLAIAGGLLTLAVVGPGGWTLDRLSRRRSGPRRSRQAEERRDGAAA